MKKIGKFCTLIIIAFLVMSASSSDPITIYFIGDSTMADYDVSVYTGTTEQRGWGQMFRQFLIGDIQFVNAARNGRSSKSFYAGSDSLWAGVRNKLKAGDYVFIQFAHNDEKDDGIAGSGGIGTDPWGEYQLYLRNFINETRKIGAIPILVTPIVRRYFSGTTITAKGAHDLSTTADDSILNYPRAMKAVARELSVPLIDHTSLTKALVESYGSTNSKSIIYVNADDTHLKAVGGTLFARLAVQELIRQNILTDYLNPSPDLIVSPTSIDFGNCYISTYASSPISISGMSLVPNSGSITVKASDGFLVSATETGTYGESVALSYTSGNLSATNIYVRFQPSVVQIYTGQITVSNPSGTPKTITLTGNALSISGGTPACIYFPLTSNATPVIIGPITSLGESWSEMYAKNYAVPSSSTTWPEGVTGSTTQRNIIIGDTWVAGEVDIVTTRYIQFGVQPAANTTFTVDSIGLYAAAAGGSGMRFRVMIAKKSDFSDAITLENKTTNASNTIVKLSYKPILQVADSEYFYLRFYPWYSSAATSKYLCLQNLTISGTVSSNENPTYMEETDQNRLKVYPNPSHGVFYTNYSGSGKNSLLKIYNLTGTMLQWNRIKTDPETIDLSGFPNGSYVLKIISGQHVNQCLLIKN
jgi:lysophospholipase L1-like esterase